MNEIELKNLLSRANINADDFLMTIKRRKLVNHLLPYLFLLVACISATTYLSGQIGLLNLNHELSIILEFAFVCNLFLYVIVYATNNPNKIDIGKPNLDKLTKYLSAHPSEPSMDKIANGVKAFINNN